MPASALNPRILDLEKDVGSPLFERLPRGVSATAAGELFLAYVRRSLKELRLVEAQIDGLRGLVHGRVRTAVAAAFEHVFHGFRFLGVILVTAIPFGIDDLVEALDNVESAAVAGDDFPTTRVLTADGIVSLIGGCMGNPFINAVYIGHPGWKAMGGRIGYSAATGVTVIVLAWLGIISVMCR